MQKRQRRICAALLLVFVLLASCACAETVRGDLSGRFDDILKIEHEGISYSLKSRISLVLAMAIDADANGAKSANFARLLAVDDAQKTFTMLDIPADALVQVESDDGNDLWYMRYGDVFALDAEPEDKCQRLLNAVNRLFGHELVEDYIAFDLEGAPVLTGGEELVGTTREKLHVLREIVDEMTTEELNDTYAQLGDHIITGMKSGAVMKIIDKADRYERLETILYPGYTVPTTNNGPVQVADAQRLKALMLELFFEESIW